MLYDMFEGAFVFGLGLSTPERCLLPVSACIEDVSDPETGR